MRATREAADKILDQRLAELGGIENGRTKVTETLGGECGSHHTATNPSGSKLGRDDGGKRVITTDPNTHLNDRSTGMAWTVRVNWDSR